MFTIVALHFRRPPNDQRSEFVWRMKHSAYFRLTRSSSRIMSAPRTLSPHQMWDISIFSLFTYLAVHGSHIKLAWIIKESLIFSASLYHLFTFDVPLLHSFINLVKDGWWEEIGYWFWGCIGATTFRPRGRYCSVIDGPRTLQSTQGSWIAR